MSEWKDRTRIPRGMSHFTRWYRPPGINHRVKHPADIDGILHTMNGNRFWMFEFKPVGSNITRGQDITLEGFSRLPGCQATLIFDPFAWDESGKEYNDNQKLEGYMYWNGKKRPFRITVGELNQHIANWFNRTEVSDS